MEFKDTEIKEPKLRNRNYVYLELLERQIKTRELFEKRLKKYECDTIIHIIDLVHFTHTASHYEAAGTV